MTTGAIVGQTQGAPSGASGGSGAGAAHIFVDGNPTLGLEVTHPDADAEWSLFTEAARRDRQARWVGETASGESVTLILPEAWAVGADGNIWQLEVQESRPPTPIAYAHTDIAILGGTDQGKGIRITFLDGTHSQQTGAAGNNWRLTVSAGASHSWSSGSNQFTMVWDFNSVDPQGNADSNLQSFLDYINLQSSVSGSFDYEATFIGGADGSEVLTVAGFVGTGASRTVDFSGGANAMAGGGQTAQLGSPDESLFLLLYATATVEEVIQLIRIEPRLSDFTEDNFEYSAPSVANELFPQSFFAGNVGDNRTASFSGGVDPIPADVTVDEDAETVRVRYYPDSTVQEVFDLIEPSAAEALFIATTPPGDMMEEPGVTRPMLAAGSLDGSGGISAFAILQDAGEATQGIEIGIDRDASWGLRGVLRRIVPLAATADVPISADQSIRLTMPTEVRTGVGGNAWEAFIAAGVAAIPAVPAVPGDRALANFQLASGGDPGIRLTFDGSRADTLGALGNDWFFTTTSGGSTVTVNVNNTTQTITIDFPSNATLGQINSAIDAYDVNGLSFSTAYLNGATGSESVSGVSTVSQGFLGGTDATPAVPAVPRGPFIQTNFFDALAGVTIPFRATVFAVSGDTLATLIAGIAAQETDGSSATFTWGTANVAKTDSTAPDGALADVSAVTMPLRMFAGGADPQILGATEDEDAQEFTVLYNPAEDTLTEVFDAIVAEDFGAVLIYGTDGDDAPEDPPFLRPFNGAPATQTSAASSARASAQAAAASAADAADSADAAEDSATAAAASAAASVGAGASAMAAAASATAAEDSATEAAASAAASSGAGASATAAATSATEAEDAATEATDARDAAETAAAQAAAGADVAVGSPKGALWATSPVLSTASRATNSEYPFASTVGWDITAEGLAAGLSDPGNGEENLPLPNIAPPGVNGWWYQAVIGDVVAGEVYYPFGQRFGSRTFPTIARVFAGLDSSDNARYINLDYRAGEVSIYGGGNGLASGTRIRIRASVARGAAGTGGEGGGVSEARVEELIAAAALASEASVTELAARVTVLEGFHAGEGVGDHTRYAVGIAASASMPTNAQWLAGATSTTAAINFPATGMAHKKCFAIPATEADLTVIRPTASPINTRDSYSPAVGADSVIQAIGGVDHKIYVQNAADFPTLTVTPFTLG